MTSSAEQELKAAFPDPTVFITIFDTVVSLITKCKDRNNIQNNIKNRENLVKSVIRTKLKENGYKGNIVEAAEKILTMAKTSPNTQPFIEECSELTFDLF